MARAGWRKLKVSKKWKARQAWRKRMIPRPKNTQPVQFFKRTTYVQNAYTVLPGVPLNNAIEFSLANVTNNAEFTALYDAYQIKAVKATLIPRVDMTAQTIGGGAPTSMPTVHSVLDYDDGNILATLSDYVQYESYKFTRGNRLHSRYLVPAVELGAQSAGVIVSAGQKKHQWLDTDEAGVAHRGIKFIIEPGTSQCLFDLKIVYYLAFKQVR